MQWPYIPWTQAHTKRYCIWFTSRLECLHLVMQSRVHLAQPHLLHSARQSHESVKLVTARLVSTELEVCQNSYSTDQVCVCVSVRVGRHVCRWASWCCFWPPGIVVTSARWITAPALQLEKGWPENWTNLETRPRVLVSFLPACLPAAVSWLGDTPSWVSLPEDVRLEDCVLLQITSQELILG